MKETERSSWRKKGKGKKGKKGKEGKKETESERRRGHFTQILFETLSNFGTIVCVFGEIVLLILPK